MAEIPLTFCYTNWQGLAFF